jgi:hypothetical protein
LNRTECKSACQLHLIVLNQHNIGIHKKVGAGSACSIKSCIRLAVRQVVFTGVLIVGQLDEDGQSFAPIGLQKTDAASYWLLIKWHCCERLAGASRHKINQITQAVGVILALT